MVQGGKPEVMLIYSPLYQKMIETYIGRKLPEEGGTEVHTHVGRHSGCYQVERSLSAYTQKTRRCVSGPGLEAAGLLYCSRWCTFSIYKKTLCVGSEEEVLSSIPVLNTADLNYFVAAWMVTLYGCSIF